MADELNGKDYVAVRRLSLADNTTIADVGQTCERVPPAPGETTNSASLERLLASGKIAPAPAKAAKTPKAAKPDAEGTA